ncbi:unnamed protein product [Gongylonema pulchrum]|uniref:Uncharacterized protein n=1 Tax=Gongylonema pulchrum TaxID=637853 RepID=A0A183CZQ8_9BILA|nr:unnamed protein product [Gongylonema pulchrum]
MEQFEETISRDKSGHYSTSYLSMLREQAQRNHHGSRSMVNRQPREAELVLIAEDSTPLDR